MRIVGRKGRWEGFSGGVQVFQFEREVMGPWRFMFEIVEGQSRVFV